MVNTLISGFICAAMATSAQPSGPNAVEMAMRGKVANAHAQDRLGRLAVERPLRRRRKLAHATRASV